jgi:hypothetical protein
VKIGGNFSHIRFTQSSQPSAGESADFIGSPLTRVEPNQRNMKTRTEAGTADAGARSSKQRTTVALMEEDMSATGLDVFAKT